MCVHACVCTYMCASKVDVSSSIALYLLKNIFMSA